jgi:hypothetical protein
MRLAGLCLRRVQVDTRAHVQQVPPSRAPRRSQPQHRLPQRPFISLPHQLSPLPRRCVYRPHRHPKCRTFPLPSARAQSSSGVQPIWEDPAHTNGKRLQVLACVHLIHYNRNLLLNSAQFLVPKSRLQVSCCMAVPWPQTSHSAATRACGARSLRCCWTATRSACRRSQVRTAAILSGCISVLPAIPLSVA